MHVLSFTVRTDMYTVAYFLHAGLLESPEYGPPHVFDYEEYWPAERVAHLSHSHPSTASATSTAPSPSLPSTRPAQQQQSVEAKAASAATQGSSISPPAPTAAQP